MLYRLEATRTPMGKMNHQSILKYSKQLVQVRIILIEAHFVLFVILVLACTVFSSVVFYQPYVIVYYVVVTP